jgi:16S rRNA (adenine1518-N6/adenine1519-N6)-dimethyltransferase
MLNLLCDTKMLFEVNKMVFSPPPKITSAIVQIIPNDEKIAKYFDKNNLRKFEIVVQQAFNQRRKMLKSSLKGAFTNRDLMEILNVCNIDGTKRAEELSIEEFWKISQSF